MPVSATPATLQEAGSDSPFDAILRIPSRFALGFMKSMDNRQQTRNNTDSVLLSETAFGHVGAGGSLGFADPAAKLAFGYTMNRMGQGILLNERGQALVDAGLGCNLCLSRLLRQHFRKLDPIARLVMIACLGYFQEAGVRRRTSRD